MTTDEHLNRIEAVIHRAMANDEPLGGALESLTALREQIAELTGTIPGRIRGAQAVVDEKCRCFLARAEAAEAERDRAVERLTMYFSVDPKQALAGVMHEAMVEALDAARAQGRAESQEQIAALTAELNKAASERERAWEEIGKLNERHAADERLIASLTTPPDTEEWQTLIRLAYADGGDGVMRINRITSEYCRVRAQVKAITAERDSLVEFGRKIAPAHATLNREHADAVERIASLTAELNHYKDQRLRAHALIDKITEAVDSAAIGDRASDWDVLDSSVRQIVSERAALAHSVWQRTAECDRHFSEAQEARQRCNELADKNEALTAALAAAKGPAECRGKLRDQAVQRVASLEEAAITKEVNPSTPPPSVEPPQTGGPESPPRSDEGESKSGVRR